MIVTVKTLSNATFKIELNETDTVSIDDKCLIVAQITCNLH